MRRLAVATLIAFAATGACSTPPQAFAEVASFEGEPLRQILVSTQDEYRAMAKIAQPGDVIVLANGTWTDFDLVLEAIFITATVFIILTIFTLQSKWDFSFMGAGLGMCSAR